MAPSFESPRYDYAGYVYSDLGPEVREKLIVAIHDERHRPGTDWLTFKKIQQVATNVPYRDNYATKNLVNNMLVIGIRGSIPRIRKAGIRRLGPRIRFGRSTLSYNTPTYARLCGCRRGQTRRDRRDNAPKAPNGDPV